jgi:hypothetical protein
MFACFQNEKAKGRKRIETKADVSETRRCPVSTFRRSKEYYIFSNELYPININQSHVEASLFAIFGDGSVLGTGITFEEVRQLSMRLNSNTMNTA